MDDKALELSEVTSSTIFGFSRKDVLKHGLRRALEPTVEALKGHIEDNLVDFVDANLQEEDNQYQFILTVKKFVAPEDSEEQAETVAE
jgi:hypothetical protein